MHLSIQISVWCCALRQVTVALFWIQRCLCFNRNKHDGNFFQNIWISLRNLYVYLAYASGENGIGWYQGGGNYILHERWFILETDKQTKLTFSLSLGVFVCVHVRRRSGMSMCVWVCGCAPARALPHIFVYHPAISHHISPYLFLTTWSPSYLFSISIQVGVTRQLCIMRVTYPWTLDPVLTQIWQILIELLAISRRKLYP